MGNKRETNTLSIGHGKYTFSDSSGTMYVSAIRVGSHTVDTSFNMPKNQFKESSRNAIYLPSHTSGKRDLGGFTLHKSLEVPDGTILKVVNNRKKYGSDFLNAALIVMVHRRAGMISIRGSMPNVGVNAIGESVELFAGSGMVLTDEQVRSLGYTVHSVLSRKYRSRKELVEAFDVEHISKGADFSEFKGVSSSKGTVEIFVKPEVRKRKIVIV